MSGDLSVRATAEPAGSAFDRVRGRTLLLWGLCTILLMAVIEGDTWDGPRAVTFEYLFYGSLLLWAVWQCARAGVRMERLVGPWPRDAATWGLAALALPLVLFSVGALWAVAAMLSLVLPGPLPEWLSEGAEPTWYPDAPLWSALSVLSTVLVAPAVEELIFRGVLLHRWGRRWGQPRAVLATSLAFAVLHGDVLGGFVFGVVMALLYVRTRTLLVPIACHAANNAIAVAAELLPAEGSPAALALDLLTEGWGAPVALVAGTMALYASRRGVLPPPGWRLPYTG